MSLICADCKHSASVDASEPYGIYYTHGSVLGSPDCKHLQTHCKCGYEFADGMKYCPMCGIKRKKCPCGGCIKVEEVD